tara:strand:- start:265 stop:432 length:168 start_codon:yes stop_codon:yes gene_type:complete
MKDLTDTVIQEHEDMVDDPNDPTDDELVDTDIENVEAIINFLEDLNLLEMDLENF